MNDPRYWTWRSGRFVQRFREIAAPNKIRETLQEFADVDCRPMQVKETLAKNSDRDDTARQNWPHQ
jgi:hypothetical protein